MKQTIIRMLVPVAATALVLSVACGGDKGGTAAVSPNDPQAAVEKAIDEAVKDPEKARKAADEVAQKGMSGAGRCEVKVSGDENVSFSSGGGPAAVGTDYWYSDAELRQSLRMLEKVGGSSKSDAEIDRAVDAAMRQDPRFMLLVVNCGNAAEKNGSVSLLPGEGSKYADVPFGAKSYTIAKGGLLGGGAKAGEFSVIFSVKDGVYALDEPGELKITKFDKSGIAGTFSFKATERLAQGAPKKVTVQGTFDFPCSGGANCKK